MRCSSFANCMSRRRSASWVVASEVTRKLSESTAQSEATSGWPNSAAIGPDSATPSVVNTTPAPIDIQNAVARSSSVRFLRWITAAPSARSEKTSTRLANTSASAARP